jgi:hypothetical protein
MWYPLSNSAWGAKAQMQSLLGGRRQWHTLLKEQENAALPKNIFGFMIKMKKEESKKNKGLQSKSNNKKVNF